MHLFDTCIESDPRNLPLTCSEEMSGSEEGKGDWVPMMAECRAKDILNWSHAAKHLRVVFLALLVTTLASFLAT